MDTNFVARINAIISNFERGVRKAQRLAKTSIPNEIETEITANTNKFQRALTKAKAMAQKWREHTVNIDGDTSLIKRAILTTKAMLKAIRKHTVNIDVDVNKWDLLKAKMVETWHNGGKALGEFSDKMDHLAGRIRSFGTVFGQQIKGMLIASFQALIPVIAGLVPAIMAVGNALKVVTGGTVALSGALAIAAGGFVGFGAMAISALTMLKDGTLQATNETRAYQRALQGVKDTWASIIKQNQAQIFNTMTNGLNAVKVALQGLNPFFSGVASQMEKASASVLKWAKTSQVAKRFFKEMGTTGVAIFGDLLRAGGQFGAGMVSMFTQLMPLFRWSSQWLRRIGEDFNKWVNSAKGQNAIKQFMEYTKTNLPIIGNIFKNTFAGINNLLKAFGQNSTNIFKWLEQMTAKFRQWSETVGKSEGFKKFVQYVQENGPVIMKLIGDIVRVLVAFGTAMAPIASALLKVIGKIVEFTAALFEAHPNVARFFGILTILGGAFWALMAPIMFISSILGNVFGVSLLQAGRFIFGFVKNASLLSGALNLLKGAFMLLTKPIGLIRKALPLLGGALAGISAPVWIAIGVITALVGVIVWLWKTNEDFRTAVINAWNMLRDGIANAIAGIQQWLTNLFTKVNETLQPIMPILQQIGQFAQQFLGVVFVTAINTLITVISGLWTIVSVVFTAIGTIISATIQLIVGLFTAFIQFLSGDFSGAWQTLQTTISNVGQTIWAGIQSIWSQIQQFLFDTYSRITGQTVSSWSQIWQNTVNYVTQIWNSVSNWFSQVVSTVGAKMGQALALIVSIGFQWVQSIIQAMRNFLNSVVQGFWNVVNACRNGMQNALNAVRGFIGDFVQAGIDLIAGMIRGIAQKVGDLARAAWNAGRAALNAAKNALDSHSPSREFMKLGRDSMTGLGMGIDKYADKAAKSSRLAAYGVMNAFDANLVPSMDLSGLNSSIASDLNGFLTDDVQHTLAEANKPVVNIQVTNEGDIDLIRNTIRDMDSNEFYT
ncbi:terminase [Staphylococcus chromogenes]|uniref:phage tail protein n=2 Tax=Staphylococcus chromogenes TaxID=46126 RepID=UPI001C3CFD74|nr:terminase [Staphylococcus chromogenes]MBV5190996.1 terminase [Staphylococcus chromogenes]MBW3131763.1 terminase [Staphylococcus chromogenes]